MSSKEKKINGLSLNECIKKLDKEIIDDEFFEVALLCHLDLEEVEEISYEEKCKLLFDMILKKFWTCIYLEDDKFLKMLKDYFNGNKDNTSLIEERLLDLGYAFMIDDKIVVPKEIRKKFFDLYNDSFYDEKLKFLISIYVENNGVLTLNRLIDLLNRYGIKDIRKNKLKTLLKNSGYYLVEDIVSVNELIFELNEDLNFIDMKEDNDYKIFDLDEIMSLEVLRLECISKIALIFGLENEMDKDNIGHAIELFTIISVGLPIYNNFINDILDGYDIKISKKNRKELISYLECVQQYVPIYILNGYSMSEYNEDEDIEVTIEDYIYLYVKINGIIEVDKLYSILKEYHNYDDSKNKFIKLINYEMVDLTICSNYICFNNITEPFINLLKKYKKKLTDYKIIDDHREVSFDVINIYDELRNLFDKYINNEGLFEFVYFNVESGFFSDNMVRAFVEDEKIRINDNELDKFIKEIRKISSKSRMWINNGFTKKELRNLKK